jgi:hypothetical protein
VELDRIAGVVDEAHELIADRDGFNGSARDMKRVGLSFKCCGDPVRASPGSLP